MGIDRRHSLAWSFVVMLVGLAMVVAGCGGSGGSSSSSGSTGKIVLSISSQGEITAKADAALGVDTSSGSSILGTSGTVLLDIYNSNDNRDKLDLYSQEQHSYTVNSQGATEVESDPVLANRSYYVRTTVSPKGSDTALRKDFWVYVKPNMANMAVAVAPTPIPTGNVIIRTGVTSAAAAKGAEAKGIYAPAAAVKYYVYCFCIERGSDSYPLYEGEQEHYFAAPGETDALFNEAYVESDGCRTMAFTFDHVFNSGTALIHIKAFDKDNKYLGAAYVFKNAPNEEKTFVVDNTSANPDYDFITAAEEVKNAEFLVFGHNRKPIVVGVGESITLPAKGYYLYYYEKDGYRHGDPSDDYYEEFVPVISTMPMTYAMEPNKFATLSGSELAGVAVGTVTVRATYQMNDDIALTDEFEVKVEEIPQAVRLSFRDSGSDSEVFGYQMGVIPSDAVALLDSEYNIAVQVSYDGSEYVDVPASGFLLYSYNQNVMAVELSDDGSVWHATTGNSSLGLCSSELELRYNIESEYAKAWDTVIDETFSTYGIFYLEFAPKSTTSIGVYDSNATAELIVAEKSQQLRGFEVKAGMNYSFTVFKCVGDPKDASSYTELAPKEVAYSFDPEPVSMSMSSESWTLYSDTSAVGEYVLSLSYQDDNMSEPATAEVTVTVTPPA